jgi:hypothetical protein
VATFRLLKLTIYRANKKNNPKPENTTKIHLLILSLVFLFQSLAQTTILDILVETTFDLSLYTKSDNDNTELGGEGVTKCALTLQYWRSSSW